MGERAAGDYQVRYRRTHADKARRTVDVNAARGRALRRLGQAHPAELERLLDEERARVGLPPVDKSKRPRSTATRAT